MNKPVITTEGEVEKILVMGKAAFVWVKGMRLYFNRDDFENYEDVKTVKVGDSILAKGFRDDTPPVAIRCNFLEVTK